MTGPDQRRPHALVVVESMFGNTEQVARAVAAGLADGGVDASVVDVGAAPIDLPARGGPPGPRLSHARVLHEPARHPGGRGAAGRPSRTRDDRAARVAGHRAPPGRPAQPGRRRLRHARLEGTTAARGRGTPRCPPGPAPGTDGARTPRGVPGRGHPRTAGRRRARTGDGVGSPAGRRICPGPHARPRLTRAQLAGTLHVTLVPSPRTDSTTNVPPRCSARSRMLRNPDSGTDSSRPRPSSVTLSTTSVPALSRTLDGPRVRVPAGVRQRLTEHGEHVGGEVAADQGPYGPLELERGPELQGAGRPVDQPGHLGLDVVRGVRARRGRRSSGGCP